MRRVGAGEGLLVIGILALGSTVRWWHLGTPSLWWDELVHLSFAAAANPWEVFRQVQLGIPAGAGNAGAVPFDYVVLHVFTWLVEQPPVERYEAYYRLPSYVWSCAALLALWAYARATFGRLVAVVAMLLLALSLPHVLYAAEARFYSLLILMSVLNLAAFTWVVRRPDRPRAWIAYTTCNVVFFLTGLLSLLVLPWQYLTLAVLALGRGAAGDPRRRLALWASTLVVLACTFAVYYADIDLWARGNRPGVAIMRPWLVFERAFDFMSFGDRRSLWLFAWGAVVTPIWVWRTRRALVPVVLTLILVEAATVPILVEVVQWKQYYFHVRHALFLLPGLELLAAIGLCAPLAWLASAIPPRRDDDGPRRWLAAAAAVAAVLWLRLPAVRDYMARPHDFFARTKTQRDFRSLALDLRARTRFYAPGEKYLLIVDRIGPGHIGNPTLARYLRWYELDGRVVLLGTEQMKTMAERLAAACGGSCRGHDGAALAQRLELTGPFELEPVKLHLVGVGTELGAWPGVVRDVGMLVYPQSNRWPDVRDTDRWPYVGAYLLEPRDAAPSLAAPGPPQ